MSVFISYSTKDSEFVDKLSMSLVKQRINVWLDKWEMKPGDSLIDKIQHGITDSSFLLVVLSKNSIESEWCKKELNSALIRELEEKKVVIVPILLEDCKVPLFLKEKVYADFRNDFDEGFKALIRPLSILFSEHMGRKSNPDTIIDYAVNWWVENSLFRMTIDFITWYKNENKSILLQVNIIGSENATNRFFEDAEKGLTSLMKETLIQLMRNSPDFNIDILTKSDEVYWNNIKIISPKDNINFDVKLRAVLMGEDNGNDILIHLDEFLAILAVKVKT